MLKGIFSGLFWCSVFSLQAVTIRVAPGTPVANIQEAIRMAAPYDIISITPGIYFEHNIIIDRPLTIKGTGGAIIDAENKGEIFTIQANHVTIEGMELRHTGYSSLNELAGIKLLSSRYCVLNNNTTMDCCFGIYLSNCSNCVVKNNTIRSVAVNEQRSGNGIHLWKCDSNTIQSNTITGHRDGIYFEFVTHCGVYKNVSKNNLRYGIHFMFSNNDEYAENIFSHNGAGVAVMFSKNVTIKNNTFEFSEGGAAYGILLKEITDSRMEGNTFNKNSVAIYMEGSNRFDIIHNIISNNGWACRVQASCYDVKLHENNFMGNSFDIATNGSLMMNNFDGNYWDKYEGYDLNKDKVGDIPYNAVSLYSMIVERTPYALILYRSFLVSILDRTEKAIPTITPAQLKDNRPAMQPFSL